ncbi:unnamed protein product [Brassica oleracea]
MDHTCKGIGFFSSGKEDEGIADADKLQKTLQRSFKRTYTFFISTTIVTDERSDGYD